MRTSDTPRSKSRSTVADPSINKNGRKANKGGSALSCAASTTHCCVCATAPTRFRVFIPMAWEAVQVLPQHDPGLFSDNREAGREREDRQEKLGREVVGGKHVSVRLTTNGGGKTPRIRTGSWGAERARRKERQVKNTREKSREPPWRVCSFRRRFKPQEKRHTCVTETPRGGWEKGCSANARKREHRPRQGDKVGEGEESFTFSLVSCAGLARLVRRYAVVVKGLSPRNAAPASSVPSFLLGVDEKEK